MSDINRSIISTKLYPTVETGGFDVTGTLVSKTGYYTMYKVVQI
jgi:hypothetical protein